MAVGRKSTAAASTRKSKAAKAPIFRRKAAGKRRACKKVQQQSQQQGKDVPPKGKGEGKSGDDDGLWETVAEASRESEAEGQQALAGLGLAEPRLHVSDAAKTCPGKSQAVDAGDHERRNIARTDAEEKVSTLEVGKFQADHEQGNEMEYTKDDSLALLSRSWPASYAFYYERHKALEAPTSCALLAASADGQLPFSAAFDKADVHDTVAPMHMLLHCPNDTFQSMTQPALDMIERAHNVPTATKPILRADRFSACVPCRKRKIRCVPTGSSHMYDRDGNIVGVCATCVRRNKECVWPAMNVTIRAIAHPDDATFAHMLAEDTKEPGGLDATHNAADKKPLRRGKPSSRTFKAAEHKTCARQILSHYDTQASDHIDTNEFNRVINDDELLLQRFAGVQEPDDADEADLVPLQPHEQPFVPSINYTPYSMTLLSEGNSSGERLLDPGSQDATRKSMSFLHAIPPPELTQSPGSSKTFASPLPTPCDLRFHEDMGSVNTTFSTAKLHRNLSLRPNWLWQQPQIQLPPMLPYPDLVLPETTSREASLHVQHTYGSDDEKTQRYAMSLDHQRNLQMPGASFDALGEQCMAATADVGTQRSYLGVQDLPRTPEPPRPYLSRTQPQSAWHDEEGHMLQGSVEEEQERKVFEPSCTYMGPSLLLSMQESPSLRYSEHAATSAPILQTGESAWSMPSIYSDFIPSSA